LDARIYNVVFSVKVTIRLFTSLRELAGKRRETLQFNSGDITVRHVLEKLAQKNGREFQDYLFKEKTVRGHLQVLLNGRNVSLMEHLKTCVKDGDEIAIIPPVGGG